jgi:hypothetical protein
LFLLFGNHQHFFQPAQIRCGLHLDLQKHFMSRVHLGHCAHGQPFREYLVASAAQQNVSWGHLLIAHHPLQDHLSIRSSSQHALQPGLLQHRAHAAGLVVDHQHQRSRRIYAQNLSHDPARGDHGHISRNTVVRTFVDVYGP